MYVFGGKNATGVAQDQAYRFFLNALGNWVWEPQPTAGTAPSARFGHALIYDNVDPDKDSNGDGPRPRRNRMIIFGGLTADGVYADNDVYALDFSTSPNPTWSRLTLRPGSASPTAREGFVFLSDSTGKKKRNSHTPTENWSRAILYGGKTAGSPNDEVWMLWFDPDDPNIVEWQLVSPAQDPQGPTPARSGHSAVWLRSPKQIMVFGGDTGGTTDANIWLLDVDWPGTGN